MSDHGSNDTSTARLNWQPGRLEAFSDGVFSIAITLLVLDLAVHPGWEINPLGALLKLWPQYLAYIVSFATIGAVWIGHAGITHYLHHVDWIVVRINLLLLLAVSILPFPTRLLAEFLSHESGRRVAAVVLGMNLWLAVFLLSLLLRAALRRGLVHPDVDDEEVSQHTRSLTPGMAGYIVFILVGLFLPLVAVVGYLLVTLTLLLPIRHRSAARPSTTDRN